MKCAVIDISATGVSLAVSEGEEHSFKDHAGFSVQSYLEGDRLSAHGTEKIVEKIAAFQAECKKLGVERLHVISTSAMRTLENAQEVAEEIRLKTGVTVNRVDGQTEAYCAYVANERYAAEGVLLAEIGGGSVELCDMGKTKKEDMKFFDFGAITLQRKFVKEVFPDEEECAAIKKYVKKKWNALMGEEQRFSSCVIAGATGGAVYEIYKDFYDIEEDEGIIGYKKLKKLIAHLMDSEERYYLLIKNAPEKIYFIVVAAIMLLQIMKRSGAKEALVSDLGVKDGYLKLCLRGEIQGEVSPLGVEKESMKITTIEEFARHVKENAKQAKPKAKEKKKNKDKADAATEEAEQGEEATSSLPDRESEESEGNGEQTAPQEEERETPEEEQAEAELSPVQGEEPVAGEGEQR